MRTQILSRLGFTISLLGLVTLLPHCSGDDANVPQAMFVLANAYRDGDGVAKDEARALALYEKAAELDHPESIQALAMAYQNGELGLERDPARFDGERVELAHAQKHPPAKP